MNDTNGFIVIPHDVAVKVRRLSRQTADLSRSSETKPLGRGRYYEELQTIKLNKKWNRPE